MSSPVLQFQDVSKVYAAGLAARTALLGVSFGLEPGEVIALVGRSGSGKSTLLHLAAGIDTPSSGRVFLDGEDLTASGDTKRTLLRRERVGIVFQFFHLLPHLSVEENVSLPEWIAGGGSGPVRERVMELLERVGLSDRAPDPVERLSGGEMQRVAICRALLRRPRLLLADEPTGNLDEDSGRVVLDLLFGLAKETGSALLIATHSLDIASRAHRVWRLRDGVLEAT
jgi:putative ABC transport system ATP-binding protein